MRESFRSTSRMLGGTVGAVTLAGIATWIASHINLPMWAPPCVLCASGAAAASWVRRAGVMMAAAYIGSLLVFLRDDWNGRFITQSFLLPGESYLTPMQMFTVAAKGEWAHAAVVAALVWAGWLGAVSATRLFAKRE